jgi:hypothetical protein
MKVGLWNLEKKIENTALMQVSQFHKQQGDLVEWYSPLFCEEYSKVYVASLFANTRKPKVKPKFICGGTGFDDYEQGIITKLPREIEECDLDYGLFPNCRTSYLWFSRGCIHKCPFCVVWKKEGYMHSVEPKNLNPKGKTITVVDNNPFMNPKWEEMIEFLLREKKPVNFCSGVSLRDFNDLHGLALQKLRFFKQLNVAWDNPREDLRPKIEQLLRYVKPHNIQCYVLVGYWSTKEEDLVRIYWLRSKGIDPYVMPYVKTRYTKDLARWCNTRKAMGACPDFDKYDRWTYEHSISLLTHQSSEAKMP